MANNLVWADLSADQLDSLRSAGTKKPGSCPTGRELLAKYMHLKEGSSPKHTILLDLYSNTLKHGQELQLSDDKLSALVSIMKTVHERSTAGRLPLDRSFALFKDLLLKHSIQRPPISVGLFSLPEYKQLLAWGLDTYYRHYKLYQYVFTERILLNVTQQHPSDGVETAPVGGLQPLDAALTQEQHNAILSEEERQRAAAAAAAASEAEAAAEAERLARLREEYEAAVPDEIRDRVQAAVEKELAQLKAAMEAKFQQQTTQLQERLAQLEVKAAS